MILFNYKIYILELCSDKFTYLQSNWLDFKNFFSNKVTMEALVPINESCYYDYSILNEDKSNYGFNWSSLVNRTTTKLLTTLANSQILNVLNSTSTSTSTTTTTTLQVNTTNSAPTVASYFNNNLTSCFRYTKSSVLKNNPYSGQYATYLGGGYAYSMNSSFADTIGDLSVLQATNWINKNTRAVFFELTLYNPNINMLCSLQFLFEILPTGQVMPSVSFNTVNLWSTSREVMATACIAVFLVVLAVLMAKEVKLLVKMRKAYFKGFWVYIDWSLFALTITSLPMYLYKIYALHDIKNNFSLSNYINLTTLTTCSSNLSIMLALCSFLVTIKLIRLLRHNRKLSYLIVAIKNGAKEMTSFLVVFLIMYMAFVQLMYVIYNDKIFGYATFTRSMITNFLYLLGYMDRSLLQVNFTMAAIILTSFIVIVCIIMVNFVITILSDSLGEARKEAKKYKQDSGVLKHLKEKLKSKLKPYGKQDEAKLDLTANTDNIVAFENSTKKLIDVLKGRIQSEEFSEI